MGKPWMGLHRTAPHVCRSINFKSITMTKQKLKVFVCPVDGHLKMVAATSQKKAAKAMGVSISVLKKHGIVEEPGELSVQKGTQDEVWNAQMDKALGAPGKIFVGECITGEFRPQKTTLERLAEASLSRNAQSKQDEEIEMNRRADEQEKWLLDQFEKGFQDQLPILKEAGISYSAHLIHRRYSYQGGFIKFSKGGTTLEMQIHDSVSYRYENPERDRMGSMQFGKWPKETFIEWLYQHFFELAEPEPSELFLGICERVDGVRQDSLVDDLMNIIFSWETEDVLGEYERWEVVKKCLEKILSLSTNKFQQGYACAVASIIRMDGTVEANTREAFVSGFNVKKDDLEELGIDPYDLEVLQPLMEELK